MSFLEIQVLFCLVQKIFTHYVFMKPQSEAYVIKQAHHSPVGTNLKNKSFFQIPDDLLKEIAVE